jgi:cytochrome c2
MWSKPLSAAFLCVTLGGCAAPPDARVDRGRAAIVRYGCGACHTVAGIPSARGLVGPPLSGLRERAYIAGMLSNSSDNLQRWIQNPKTVNPGTAMPALGLSARDAADIAAYIYSIP